jgi:hypothetical protein
MVYLPIMKYRPVKAGTVTSENTAIVENVRTLRAGLYMYRTSVKQAADADAKSRNVNHKYRYHKS